MDPKVNTKGKSEGIQQDENLNNTPACDKEDVPKSLTQKSGTRGG